MLSQITLLFIIFMLLLFTSVIFVLIRGCKKRIENFTTPTAVNVPAANNLDGKMFYVGNRIPEKPEREIVSDIGEYMFRKPELLYDGVWGENCRLDGEGMEKCDWMEKDANFPLDKKGFSYGADKFFHMPEKKLKIGERVINPPDCPASAKMYDNGLTYEQNMVENAPVYLQTPDMEDILGFVPKNNNNFMGLPPPRIASF